MKIGDRVTVMIGNVYCARARVEISYGTEHKWCAIPVRSAKAVIAKREDLLPWRYLLSEDEGVYWIRGWSRKNVSALRVAAALAITNESESPRFV